MSMDTAGIEEWLREQTSQLASNEESGHVETDGDIPEGFELRKRFGELVVEYGLEADESEAN